MSVRSRAAGLVSCAALLVAVSARAEIQHEPGRAAALYEAYLDHVLGTDEHALERAAALASDSSFLALERAFDAGRRGDRTAMLAMARKAVELDAQNCDALSLLARVEFRMLEEGRVSDDDVESAMTHGEGALRLGCADAEIHDRLAGAHAVLAARARAARDTAGAAEHRAGQRRVLEHWADTLHQDMAYQRLADLARETDDAALEERALDALLSRQERTVLLLQRLAEVRAHLGRCEEAIPLLEEAAASPTLDAYSAISVRVNLGECALEVGPMGTALAAFDKALELDPTNRRAALGRAEALWTLGRRDDAIETVESIGVAGGRREPSGSKVVDSRRDLDDALARARWMSARRLDGALSEARRAVGLAASGSAREQAAAQALLSAILLDGGDFAGAESAAKEGLAREPSSEACLMSLLTLEWALGRRADAVAEIARVESSIDPSASWLQRVGRWEATRGLDASARAHALAALAALEASSGPDPSAKGAVAEVLLGAGDPEGAERLLRAGLALRADDDDLSFGLADALADQGRRDEALAVLPQRDGAGEYLLARLASWHAVHPAAPGTATADSAVNFALAARAKVGPGSHPAKLARFDGIVAGACLAAHRPAEAARAFADALSRDALQPADRWLGAATAAERTGNLAEALALVESAARTWTDDTSVDLRRSSLLIQLGRVPEGIARAESVLKIIGTQPMGHGQVASSLANAGALADSRRIIDAALARWPQHSSLWLTSGRIRERAGDIDGAVSDLRRGLELDPTAPVALNALGYMLADHDRELEEAIRLLRQAVAARPHESAYLDSLGWALLRAGRLEEGTAALDKAAARDRDSVIVMHQAKARDLAGRAAEALALYREALAAGLEENVATVEARVKELEAAGASRP